VGPIWGGGKRNEPQLLPNLIWTKNQPENYEKYVVNENKVLLAFERIGEVLVSWSCRSGFRDWTYRDSFDA